MRIESATVERVELTLESAFRISRGTAETVETVIVHVEDERGTVGIGAATPSAYYGETAERVERLVPALVGSIEGVTRLQTIEDRLRERAPDQAAARAAVSVALHDLVARRADEPLYRRLGLSPSAPRTSYTVAIDTPEAMADRARRASQAGYPILKLKVGTDDDRARIEAVREAAPGARIRVDANGGWTVEEAIEATDWLATAGVEFVEQPVPADTLGDLEGVAAGIPVAADESCVTAADVSAVADAVDIVVVKLMKCGGIRPAIRQIETAHAHGLEVMVGCMIESNASIAAAAHLAPLAEYADLDGSLLCVDDPYDGVPMPEGRIDLAAVDCGTGVTR